MSKIHVERLQEELEQAPGTIEYAGVDPLDATRLAIKAFVERRILESRH